jgi:hypothetical protein
MTIEALPDRTVRNMAAFMQRLRSMHDDDALAFELFVRHVAAAVEDQRRSEGTADPRDLLTPATDECKILHQQKLPPDWAIRPSDGLQAGVAQRRSPHISCSLLESSRSAPLPGRTRAGSAAASGHRARCRRCAVVR